VRRAAAPPCHSASGQTGLRGPRQAQIRGLEAHQHLARRLLV